MVNPVNFNAPQAAADPAPKAPAPAPTVKVEKAEVAPPPQKPAPVKVAAKPVEAVSTQPLVPPLTSLALFKDAETGMQVAVVRDRVSGQVIEQFPTERARRLAAMVKQQEIVVQELQKGQVETGIDLKT